MVKQVLTIQVIHYSSPFIGNSFKNLLLACFLFLRPYQEVGILMKVKTIKGDGDLDVIFWNCPVMPITPYDVFIPLSNLSTILDCSVAFGKTFFVFMILLLYFMNWMKNNVCFCISILCFSLYDIVFLPTLQNNHSMQ